MEEQQIKDILDFVDSVLKDKSDAEHRSIQSALDLAEGVAGTIAKNKHLVPYHLNLIDELHINENGHSRILCKLLRYKSQSGEYVVLQSLLAYIAEQNKDIAAERKSQVGTGDRSERIRTYNFPQGRVSDHRINLTLYKLDSFLDGDIDEMIDGLITVDQTEKMASI